MYPHSSPGVNCYKIDIDVDHNTGHPMMKHQFQKLYRAYNCISNDQYDFSRDFEELLKTYMYRYGTHKLFCSKKWNKRLVHDITELWRLCHLYKVGTEFMLALLVLYKDFGNHTYYSYNFLSFVNTICYWFERTHTYTIMTYEPTQKYIQ